jgi:HD superfamily phosphohydrolase YqeK
MISFFSGLKLIGDLEKDVYEVFAQFGRLDVWEHSKRVAAEGVAMAKRLNFPDAGEIKTAAFLHDIGRVIPAEERVKLAAASGIEVCEEERLFPLILHQKLSKVIANAIFNVTDELILEAIGCHTTLRKNPTNKDMMLFLADKLAEWQGTGIPTHIRITKRGLDVSLERGTFVYLEHLWENRSEMTVIHPWLGDVDGCLKANQ